MISEALAAKLFKAEHFPHLEFGKENDKGVLEWADWELEKLEGCATALLGALGSRPVGTGASIRDIDLIGFLSTLEGRLHSVRAALLEVSVGDTGGGAVSQSAV